MASVTNSQANTDADGPCHGYQDGSGGLLLSGHPRAAVSRAGHAVKMSLRYWSRMVLMGSRSRL
jgi:hypothetical protein